MTKKERIEELERKVAELEARPATTYVYEFYRHALPDPNRCRWCGGSGWHSCGGYPYWIIGGGISSGTIGHSLGDVGSTYTLGDAMASANLAVSGGVQ